METFFKENLGVPFSDGVPFNLFGVAKVVTSAAFREFLRIVIIITCWKGLVCKVSKVIFSSTKMVRITSSSVSKIILILYIATLD